MSLIGILDEEKTSRTQTGSREIFKLDTLKKHGVPIIGKETRHSTLLMKRSNTKQKGRKL